MEIQEQSIDLSKEIKLYTSKWKLFVLFTSLAVFGAYMYLRYATSTYSTTTTILIKDEEDSRGLSELAALSDLSSLSDLGSSDVDDEVEILKSKTLLETVVKNLGVNVSVYEIGKVKNKSAYSTAPFKVSFVWDPIKYKDQSLIQAQQYQITLNTQGGFTVKDLINESSYESKFGEDIFTAEGQMKVEKSSFYEGLFIKEEPILNYLVSVNSVTNTAKAYQSMIGVAPKSKNSNVVDLSLTLDDKYKAQAILNSLVDSYNQQAINDKNLVSVNTSNFINERLNIITKELNQVENQKSSFKRRNNLADIQSEAQLFIEQVGDAQQKEFEIETQINLTNSIIFYLANPNRDTDLLPANIGIDNNSINMQIQEFNRIVLERDRLLEGSTLENPLVINLNQNISSQKSILKESLKNQLNNLQITKQNLLSQKELINTKINSIPDQEKSYRSIERKQTIKETLYLFLLQKREETSIQMAVTAPLAKIIDRAYTANSPVSPKPKIIYLAALVLGFMIPFAYVYIKNLLNTKVEGKSDITNQIKDTPVLVEIPTIKAGDADVLAQNDRSSLGESFRILRTNLNYITKPKKVEGKALKIFVTSTVKGEGKTFIAFNTVLSLADSSKKVLIIGADIRNPQLHRYIQGAKNTKGLSEYLYDNSVDAHSLIQKITINTHKVDFVNAGRIPPNPSELLMNGRFENLITELENDYDIIVVDTAPTMLVTDTLLLSEKADTIMYVVRSGYTEKDILNHPKDLIEDGKLKNVAFVLNDVEQEKVGYGYGYGYGATKKSFFKRVFG